MLEKLLALAVRSYVKGPAKSWLYSSAAIVGLRAVRSATGRRPVVETVKLKPGKQYVIEQVSTTHKAQISSAKVEAKGIKAAKKAEKRAHKQAKKVKKAAKAERRAG